MERILVMDEKNYSTDLEEIYRAEELIPGKTTTQHWYGK